MLCLRSFHGDRGVPWWLIDTQGAIHLYTGCVWGRAAGTTAPTTSPKCKCKGKRRLLYSSGLIDLKLPSDWTLCHRDHFLLFFPVEMFLVIFCLVSFLPNALIVLTDTEITSHCAVECSKWAHTYSAQSLLWYDECKISSGFNCTIMR